MTENSAGLTIVGLGPGTWESLTMEAASILRDTAEVYVRTVTQPSIDSIRQELSETIFHSFDELYESLSSLPAVYERIADSVLSLAQRPEGVVYAVPGSPSIGETTVRLLLERCHGAGIAMRMVRGLSFVESVLGAVGIAEAGWVQAIVAADVALLGSENAVGEVAGHDELLPWRAPVPTAPLVVSYLYDTATASGVKLWLARFYGDEHPIQVIHAPGRADCRVETIPLFELDRRRDVDHLSAVYVPPLDDLDNVRTFAGLMQITRRLRAPGGCPWDREQTHATLKPYLLEEAYEVLDALDEGNPEVLAEELGDLMYQITIHSQVAAEAGEFDIEDVMQSIICKMIGRHPHVFGDLELESAQDVRHAWEGFKQRQKPKRESVLEEIPKGLPALPQSNLMQKRAASVGFEWPALIDVIAKVEEELREFWHEVDKEAPKDRQREEFGDILFAMVSVARHLKIDPEEALRLANRKFATRFGHVEAAAAAQGKALRDLTPDELDVLWNAAKQHTGGQPS